MSPPRPTDRFTAWADGYAAHRPTYPEALFAYLASLCPRHHQAWDCGTGNGQAATGLAGHFAAVLATDPSGNQLAHARPHPRVTYRQTDETASGLPSAGTDLVAAAQAFHWFDAPAFFAEAARVGRAGGILAVWCYGIPAVTPAVDAVVRAFHDGTVGADWPVGRALVTDLYRSVALPFPGIAAPPFAIERSLDLAGFVAYVGSWSAVSRHRARTGHDPIPELRRRLLPAWGADALRRVTWPIGLRLGRMG